jgi:hypothetical protein
MSFFERELAIAVPCSPLLGCFPGRKEAYSDEVRLGELSAVWLRSNSPPAKFHTLKKL